MTSIATIIGLTVLLFALVPRLIAASDAIETFFVTETAAQRR